MNTIKPFVALVASVLLAAPALAQEIRDTRIGKLSFENGYPSKDTATKLFQRATQAYLWALLPDHLDRVAPTRHR